ncbi:MAG: phosphatidylglycerol lysyltransferase domain-containing protein [Thermodesulfobacteriota bacterium]
MTELIKKYLTTYGSHSSAYSSIQEGLEHFVVSGTGYIPYALTSSAKPIAFVLSNPLCRPEDFWSVMELFLKRFPRAVFIQVTVEAARVLHEMGFYVNEMGVETEIMVEGYTFGGRSKESARRVMRRALEAGTVVEEVGEIGPFKDELETVSREWLATRTVNDRELWFMARKAVYETEADVRKFISRDAEGITGFVFFDPMYREGRVYGYCAGILRMGKRAHGGTRALIIKEALKKFSEEGVEVLSLGLSPFFDVDDRGFRHSAVMKHVFRFLYETGEAIYPFKNLTFAKSRYGGGFKDGLYRDGNVIKKKVYFAHRSRFPLRELYQASRMIGVVEGVTPAFKKILSRKKKALPSQPVF